MLREHGERYARQMAKEYTTLRLQTDVAESVRQLGRRVSFEAGRDVAQSDLISAALWIAEQHYGELAERLGIPARGGK